MALLTLLAEWAELFNSWWRVPSVREFRATLLSWYTDVTYQWMIFAWMNTSTIQMPTQNLWQLLKRWQRVCWLLVDAFLMQLGLQLTQCLFIIIVPYAQSISISNHHLIRAKMHAPSLTGLREVVIYTPGPRPWQVDTTVLVVGD